MVSEFTYCIGEGGCCCYGSDWLLEYIKVVVFAGMYFAISLTSFPFTISKGHVENAIHPPGFVTQHFNDR